MDADTAVPVAFPMARRSPFDPPPEYPGMRAERPVVRGRLDFDGSEVWLVSRYEDVRTVLADPVTFSSDFSKPGFPARMTTQPPGAGTFIRMDAPDHTRLRAALRAEFTVARVESMRPAVRGMVAELVEKMAAGPRPVDLVEAFALPLPSLVICELLGVPYAERGFFYETTTVIGSRDITVEQRQQVRSALREYLERLVEARIQEPADDVVSRLVARREETGVTADEVVGIATLLLIAGYETIANMIALGTATLLQHPDQLAALAADPSRVKVAVEELLRHQTIMQYGIRRAATRDIELGGTLIRAGEGVVVLTASANRDESRFPDPDRFDAARNPRHHVAFGYGVHQCLGQLLARVELEEAWVGLLTRLPGLRLAVPVEEVPFKHDTFVYGIHALPVTW